MITRNEAKERMYKHLCSYYDLTRSEAKETFEMQLIDEIYDNFERGGGGTYPKAETKVEPPLFYGRVTGWGGIHHE